MLQVIFYVTTNIPLFEAWPQKIAILIRIKFLNGILKCFIVLIKTIKLWNFWVVLKKPCLHLMMSFKNCIRIRIASFCHPAYYFWRLRRFQTSVSRPCALGGVDWTQQAYLSHVLSFLYPSHCYFYCSHFSCVNGGFFWWWPQILLHSLLSFLFPLIHQCSLPCYYCI